MQTPRPLSGLLYSGGRLLRSGQRSSTDMRQVEITPHCISSAEGSALIRLGETQVICTASIEDGVPAFLKGTGRGWITSEYAMIPRATETRTPREATRGRQGGRTMEIQRLIGRSLRAVTDMEALGERTVWVDCDVIQADGGTRCAAICGGYVALQQALCGLRDRGRLADLPLRDSVAAVSVGIVAGEPLLEASALRPKAPADAVVIADDSGLMVHALGGRPGVFSSRYAGPDATYADNCRRLLEELEGRSDRRAAFVCVLVALVPGGETLV